MTDVVKDHSRQIQRYTLELWNYKLFYTWISRFAHRPKKTSKIFQ